MSNNNKILTICISSLAVSCVMSATLVQAALTNQSKVVIRGIGAVRIGMTVSQASQAAGTRLVSTGEYPTNNSCQYVKPQKGPSGLGFMVTNGRISRVDVWTNRTITTLRGARIGDTEARIKSLYPGQIKVTPHQYVSGGHYLTFVPRDAADRNYRILFETDGKRVTQIRSGKLPEVNFVEGCS